MVSLMYCMLISMLMSGLLEADVILIEKHTLCLNHASILACLKFCLFTGWLQETLHFYKAQRKKNGFALTTRDCAFHFLDSILHAATRLWQSPIPAPGNPQEHVQTITFLSCNLSLSWIDSTSQQCNNCAAVRHPYTNNRQVLPRYE